MNLSQLIVNWLLVSVSEDVPLLWTFISKEVKHINNGMKMWSTMKLFVSEVKRVAIDKVCWKSKMKYWYYMSTIKVCDKVHNDFNIKYMVNNKRKNSSWKTVYNRMSSSNIFYNPNNVL